MILFRRDGKLLLVEQMLHAQMSWDIARRWRMPSAFEEPLWQRFLSAVRRHDEGWMDADRLPLVESDGRPRDFKNYPTELHVEIWRRSVSLAEENDPYVALIVAQHAWWLYRHLPVEGGEAGRLARSFLADQHEAMKRNVARLESGGPAEQRAVREPHLSMARRLLSFFDSLSLMLLGAIELSSPTEVLVHGEARSSLRLEAVEGGCRIGPWPFAEECFSVGVEATELTTSRFASPAALGVAIERSPRTRLLFRLRPEGPASADRA